jgi:Mn2+/Fe2+ NRAMP family transporter
MVITEVVTYGVLLLERKGFRPMEIIIGALVALIGLCKGDNACFRLTDMVDSLWR